MRTLRIAHKLWLLSLLLGGLLIVTSGVGLWGTSRLADQLDHEFQSRTRPLAELAQALDKMHRSKEAILVAFSAPDKDIMENQLRKMFAIDKEVAHHLQTATAVAASDAEEGKATKALLDAWQTYSKARNSAIETGRKEEVDSARITFRAEAAEPFEIATQKMTELLAIKQKAALSAYDDARSRSHGIRAALLGVAGVGLVFGALMALSLIRSVTRPLASAVEFAERIAAGDLSQTLKNERRDETGQLLSALTAMQQQLRQMFSALSSNADQLSGAAHALGTTFERVTGSAREQDEAAQAIASSVGDITAGFARVGEKSEDAQRRASDAAELSTEGSRAATQASDEVNRLAEGIRESAANIDELEVRAREIGGIANVIKEIADQTNLLALNAAIEAARAGEQGRGFAVVADEVRKLAEKTGQATTEIQKVLSAIQTEASRAVASMQQGSERVDSGVAAINALLPALGQLNDGAHRTHQDLQALGQVFGEQQSASEDIVRHVERIAGMVRDNTRSLGETEQTVRQLETLADDLRAAVGRFRL